MSEAENDAALSLQRILRADLTDLPPLPRYEDDENQYFHAVAFAAAEIAFRSMGMTTQFRAIPQYSTLAGPADMVIVDASAVPWLPIEIKKYPGDVRGKGRRQANDYRDNMRGSRTELYVSTNLEAFEIFLFDPNRPSVAAQILKTEFRDVGSLELA